MEVKVILDLSDDVQTFLERQDINVYEELRQAMPSLRMEMQPDPGAPAGSKDVTTVILAAATLISSLTPLLLRIMNQFTPPNRSSHWEIDETEESRPDGTVVVHRKHIRSREEQRPWTALPNPSSQPQKQPDNLSISQRTEDHQP